MGDNCAVEGCPLHRGGKNGANKLISFHNINAMEPKEWRDRVTYLLGREFSLEKGPKPKHLFICSRHFTEDCFIKSKVYQYTHNTVITVI